MRALCDTDTDCKGYTKTASGSTFYLEGPNAQGPNNANANYECYLKSTSSVQITTGDWNNFATSGCDACHLSGLNSRDFSASPSPCSPLSPLVAHVRSPRRQHLALHVTTT